MQVIDISVGSLRTGNTISCLLQQEGGNCLEFLQALLVPSLVLPVVDSCLWRLRLRRYTWYRGYMVL